MWNFQGQHYDENADYRAGSPHLAHHGLRDRLVATARQVLDEVVASGLEPDVLEIGAGHGGYTEPLLASGARVTAVEMSEHSVARLNASFRHNPGFEAFYEPSGVPPSSGEYSVVMCVSVLHHIPDYLSFVDSLIERVRPGGAIVTLQDPLWYPRHRMTHRLDRAAYLAWRVKRGNLLHGLATQGRRLRRVHDESNPSDMIEYHVVRSGLDEEALKATLAPHFATVELVPYWSNQSSVAQRLGERLRLRNTFGIVATNRA